MTKFINKVWSQYIVGSALASAPALQPRTRSDAAAAVSPSLLRTQPAGSSVPVVSIPAARFKRRGCNQL